jgi:hypothetical protein
MEDSAMSVIPDDRLMISRGASDVAFRMGQIVEKLLLDRATALARKSDAPIVAAEHVRSCLDDVLLDHLRKHLDERGEPDSREAA